MIILDENILAGQRVLLEGWSIGIRQIGLEIGRKGANFFWLERTDWRQAQVIEFPHRPFVPGTGSVQPCLSVEFGA